ncbi:MAG: hypothetical protein ACRD0P_24975 [Stackebrandtia sp.]
MRFISPEIPRDNVEAFAASMRQLNEAEIEKWRRRAAAVDYSDIAHATAQFPRAFRADVGDKSS